MISVSRLSKFIASLMGLALLFSAATVTAFEDSEFDVDDTLFDDTYQSEVVSSPISGEFQIKGHYNTQSLASDDRHPGLGLFRTRLKMRHQWTGTERWKSDFSAHVWLDPLLKHHEARLYDAVLSIKLRPELLLSIGNQVWVTGHADYLRGIDIWNPLDQRLPGLMDLESLRVPVFLIRARYQLGPVHVDWVANPLFQADLLPRSDSDYSFGPDLTRYWPETNLQTLPWGLSVQGQIRDLEWGLYHAQLFDRQFHVKLQPEPQAHYAFIQRDGVSARMPWRDLVFKGELAYRQHLRYGPIERPFSRWDLLLGLDYFGIKKTQIGIELLRRQVMDYAPILMSQFPYVAEHDIETVMSYQRDFYREQVQALVLWGRLGTGSNEPYYLKGQLDIELGEQRDLSIGYIDYQSGNRASIFDYFVGQDRFFANMTVSF